MFSNIYDWLSKFTGQKENSVTAAENHVMTAARLLGISEYEVFNASYQHWFGTSGDVIAIESSFTTYIFEGEIPFWARHFCHRVITMHQRGELDPAQFTLQTPTPSEHLVINTLVA